MGLILTDGGGRYTPTPEGLWPAVCVDVVELGMQETPWGPKDKIEIYWEIEELDPKTGVPFNVRTRYTASLNEKSTLRKTLEIWRGRKFTTNELRKGFNVETLLGANCQINIAHKTTDDGKVYANVTAVVPASRGQKMVPSKAYVRVKDREPDPEQKKTTDSGDGPPLDSYDMSDPPF